MRVINVTEVDRVHSITPFKGSLALRDLYLWPAWYKPKNNVLFSYENKNARSRLFRVFIENKTYTFADIQKIVREHLDINKNNQVNILHNNGRVTLMVNVKNDSSFLIHKIQFCDELLNILKLPKKDEYTGVIPGNPVDISDIKLTFNDTDLLYLRCQEIDESNVLENNINSNLIAVVPLKFSTYNNKLIRFNDRNPLFHPITKRQMVYNLHFSIQDSRGNDLPSHKFHFTILNK